MKTITIQIGNSDDKLTQTRWKEYCNQIHECIRIWGEEIHFSAPSVGWADWQNAAWVFTCKDLHIPDLRLGVSIIRKDFQQDSVAWTEGYTKFV